MKTCFFIVTKALEIYKRRFLVLYLDPDLKTVKKSEMIVLVGQNVVAEYGQNLLIFWKIVA